MPTPEPAPRGLRALSVHWQWLLVALLLTASASYMLLPLRELVRTWNDFAFVYAAGRSWREGISPYDVARWRTEWAAITPSFLHGGAPTQPYLYPPHWAIIAAPLSLLPWPIATRLWDLVNVLSYVGICAISLRLMTRRENKLSDPLLWACVALAGFNGAARWCMWECQMSMLPTLGVLGAFWACREDEQGWLAVFGFIAALKPQISFLPLIYLFLNGGRVGLLRGGAAALVVGLIAMAPTGLSKLPEQIASCYALHMSIHYNQPDQFYSLSSLFASLGGRRSLFVSPLVGVLVVVALTLLRRRAKSGEPLGDPLWEAALALSLSVAFVPLHGYDLVMYTPLMILAYAMRPRWLALVLLALASIASRAPSLEARVHVHPFAPYVSLAIAATCLFAARQTTLVMRMRQALRPMTQAGKSHPP